MAKILVVDDEDGILTILIDILEEDGFEVKTATCGKEAQDMALMYKPDLILSDIHMSPGNGIELLHWSKKEIPDTCFILMTGFADLIMANEAVEIGAYSLISKPFDEDDLIHSINDALGRKETPKDVLTDELFCRVDLNKFISGSEIPCNIYIKIRKDHYVKLADKGDPIPRESLERYREKNLKFLYVLKNEFSEFVGFNMKVLKALENNHKISNEKASSFINYSSAVIMEQTFVRELDGPLIEEVSEYSNMALNVLKDRGILFQLLMNLSTACDYTYAHSMSTAVLSYLLAKEVGWSSEPILFKVFMAGLLHDVGLKDIPKELITKNPALFSEEDKKTYQSHPVRGMEALNAAGGVPEEVILAAYQHHEDCLGHGYPLGIQKGKISPISRLVAVADIIDEVMVGEKKLTLSNYRHAVSEAEKYKANHYDKEYLQALKNILKIK